MIIMKNRSYERWFSSRRNKSTKDAAKEKTGWHKHPIFVAVFAGLVLWIVQYQVAKIDKINSHKTAHFSVIVKKKILLNLELQKHSNIVVNNVRLLDKLIKYQDRNIKVPFDINKEINKAYKSTISSITKFMNLHYENYMLQSTQSKKAYETFIRHISDEYKPGEMESYQPPQDPVSDLAIYDFRISFRIGKKGFIEKAFENWHAYIDALAQDSKINNVELDIIGLKKIDTIND